MNYVLSRDVMLKDSINRMLSESSKVLVIGDFRLKSTQSNYIFLNTNEISHRVATAAMMEGRGSAKNMPLCELENSEVVIFWGRRDEHIDQSLLSGKKIIVIDPIKSRVAARADIFVQPKPHSDLELALLLCRFLYIESSHDEKFTQKYASGLDDFYELTQNLRVKFTLDKIGVSLGELGNILATIKGTKVAILCGSGLYKYRNSVDTLRAIDAFAVMLGLFGKSGCGINFFTSNIQGLKLENIDVDFSKYETIFIANSNPLNQLPDTKRVKESLAKVKNIIYYGDEINESYEKATMSIKASECDLEEFGLSHNLQEAQVQDCYANGFDTDDGEFEFLDDLDLYEPQDGGFFLLTHKCSTNEKYVYLHPEAGFLEGEEVQISMGDMHIYLKVKHMSELRSDCAFICSNTKGLNNLTSSKRGFSSNSAIFQENKVQII